MAGKPGFGKRQDIFITVIFSAFFAAMLYLASIPISVGNHAYSGFLYDCGSGEAIQSAEVTLSGKRSYSVNASRRKLEGQLSITVDGKVLYDGPFLARYRVSRGEWSHFTYLELGFGTDFALGSYWEDSLLCRQNYKELTIPLLDADGKWYLLVVSENSDPDRAFAEARDALESRLT